MKGPSSACVMYWRSRGSSCFKDDGLHVTEDVEVGTIDTTLTINQSRMWVLPGVTQLRIPKGSEMWRVLEYRLYGLHRYIVCG